MNLPRPPKITSIRAFVSNMGSHPGELDGLILETLIRELVSTIVTPLDELTEIIAKDIKDLKLDHNITC
jgi:hypothetical protein